MSSFSFKYFTILRLVDRRLWLKIIRTITFPTVVWHQLKIQRVVVLSRIVQNTHWFNLFNIFPCRLWYLIPGLTNPCWVSESFQQVGVGFNPGFSAVRCESAHAECRRSLHYRSAVNDGCVKMLSSSALKAFSLFGLQSLWNEAVFDSWVLRDLNLYTWR